MAKKKSRKSRTSKGIHGNPKKARTSKGMKRLMNQLVAHRAGKRTLVLVPGEAEPREGALYFPQVREAKDVK